MGTQIKISRNDDLLEAQSSLHSIRPPRERGKLAGGWLQPSVCWALYKQFGVLRQLVTKVSNQAVAKGWRYTGDGIGFDWSGVDSDLETLEFQRHLKRAIKWAHVEGGAGLVFRLDEVQRPDKEAEALPVVPEHVRGVLKIEVYTATKLRPVISGVDKRYWDTCEHFELLHADGRREVIHRSRIVPIVVDDIPMDSGHSTLYNSTTGWPPSWLEGLIDSLQSWRDAESTTDHLLYTISLLVLELDGARESYTGSAQDLADFKALIQGIADTASAHGVFALPKGDRLGEVNRNATGVDKLVEQKKDTFVADTGYSAERVLMRTVSGLGDTGGGPRQNDHETIEGLQESIVTPAVNRATEFILMGYRKQFGQAVPDKWVVVFNPLAAESAEQKAKTRDANAKARKADMEAGLPVEALLSDPELDEHYPKLAEIMAAQAAAQVEAEAAAANEDPSRPPSGEELVSAAEVGRRLGVSAASVLAMRSRGTIRGWKIAGRWRFSWSQVQAALGASLSTVEAEGGEVAEDARAARVALRRGDSDGGRLALALGLDALPPGMGLSASEAFGEVWGASEAMREVFAVLERVAPTDIPVLVLGETGTGKEGIARGLHFVPGRTGPFVVINCATVGDDADEAAAVFLGDGQSPGVFERANGGTLFLDEIRELSDEGQAVLLRALSGEVRPSLGSAVSRVEVRVVSATWKGMGSGDFRRDLFERLAGVVVELPPLRDRGGDVLALAEQMVSAEAEGLGLEAPSLSSDARAVILAHRWPGNIRELRNAVRRAVLFAGDGGVIEPEHLQLHAGRG